MLITKDHKGKRVWEAIKWDGSNWPEVTIFMQCGYGFGYERTYSNDNSLIVSDGSYDYPVLVGEYIVKHIDSLSLSVSDELELNRLIFDGSVIPN
jgi:hypothetical protein